MRGLICGLIAFMLVFAAVGHTAAVAAPGDVLGTFSRPGASDYLGDQVGYAAGKIVVSDYIEGQNKVDFFDPSILPVNNNPLYTIPNPQPSPGRFGWGTATWGNDVLVGAHGSDFTEVGKAYLYDGATYALKAQPFSGENNQAGDNFGYDVDMRGNRILIGAPGDNQAGSFTGAARVYEYTNSAWSRTREWQGSVPGGTFGHFVSLSDQYAVIGAPATVSDGPGTAFRCDLTTGLLKDDIPNPSLQQNDDFFGCPVAFLGNDILVGERDNHGAVYLFDGITLALKHTFTSPSPSTAGWFGAFVSAEGGHVFITDPTDSRGAAIYDFDGSAPYLPLREKTGRGFDSEIKFVGNDLLVGGGGKAYLIEGVPEPSTLALLGIGTLAIGLGWWRRRRCRPSRCRGTGEPGPCNVEADCPECPTDV